jgi:hypothetical protein
MVDRKANTSNYTTYLGADNIEVGQLAQAHCLSSKALQMLLKLMGIILPPGIEKSRF